MTAPYIAVVGPGEDDEEAARIAEEVGHLVASAGAVVVCGGLGGAMEAACRGAKGAGGLTVGILPGDSRASANAYVDVAIPTGLGEARNVIVVRAADGVVAVRGGYGTLTELGFALRLGKPIVGIDTWQVGRGDAAGVDQFSTAADAVAALMERIP